jgi:hypothetical protein
LFIRPLQARSTSCITGYKKQGDDKIRHLSAGPDSIKWRETRRKRSRWHRSGHNAAARWLFLQKKATAAGAAAVGREFERHQSQLIAALLPRAAYAYLALLGIIAQRASTASAGWSRRCRTPRRSPPRGRREAGDATVAPRAG